MLDTRREDTLSAVYVSSFHTASSAVFYSSFIMHNMAF